MYKILSTTYPDRFNLLKYSIAGSIAGQLNKSFEACELSQLHSYLEIKELNDLRMKTFQHINDLEWQELLKLNCFDQVRKLLGPDLLIQKKINLSIQMPGDKQSILPEHSDCSSGDSPFEIVLWIPITDCFDTNSIFIYGSDESRVFYSNVMNGTNDSLDPNLCKSLSLSYGEYLLFPPTLIHGNTLNTTDFTRISLNVRIKSIFSPYIASQTPDRKFGAYYNVWNKTEMFDWNHEIYRLLK